MNPDWFQTRRVKDHLFVTTEQYYTKSNRCNIWLIKGKSRDVIIDTGLGVCNLRWHLEQQFLIEPAGRRSVVVILTHAHFDHSGGAHHFEKVYIHQNDMAGLRQGWQTSTLNYVKPLHFQQAPYSGFLSCCYQVPPTECMPIREGETINLGGGEKLEIMHLPGHTAGSIAVYNPKRKELFTGDIVYECGAGQSLIDWLPTSKPIDYLNSAERLSQWLTRNPKLTIYPGHFSVLTASQAVGILQEYIDSRKGVVCSTAVSVFKCGVYFYIVLNLFRCCPC